MVVSIPECLDKSRDLPISPNTNNAICITGSDDLDEIEERNLDTVEETAASPA